MIDLKSIADDKLCAGAHGAAAVPGDADICRRALLAYLKSATTAAAPDAIAVTHLGKLYVALSVSGGIAAIYRVRNDLQLKRMRRTPEPVAYVAELERRAARSRSRKYA